MSTKAIIHLPLVGHHSPPMGNFLRSDKYDKHIWEGKDYPLDTADDVAEFNMTLVKALAAFPERLARPMPMIVHIEDAPVTAPTAPAKRPKGWNLTKEAREAKKHALQPA